VQDLGLEADKQADKINKLSDEFTFPPLTKEGLDLGSTQEALEKFYIEEALRLAAGNESKAAKLLNVNHHTFRYRKKKLHIE
jgi:transcriptional regulator with PAS, ATPase and Fis domain